MPHAQQADAESPPAAPHWLMVTHHVNTGAVFLAGGGLWSGTRARRGPSPHPGPHTGPLFKGLGGGSALAPCSLHPHPSSWHSGGLPFTSAPGPEREG